jgi:glyoxylase-like metal-dependent hydrolase (beta-lactamase superfamily II)
MTADADPLSGLTVLERGWLSSNNVLIHPADGEAGAWLVDSGHAVHAQQTLALVRHALAGAPMTALLNTHLHSDHCGGNALLQQALGAPTWVAHSAVEAVRRWSEQALSYHATDQICPRFDVSASLAPGQSFRAGGEDWEVVHAPGHDPDSLMFFQRRRGLLLSADALWENGFGIVFPEVAGEPGFDGVQAALDTIAALPVRWVVPGHGAPFADVPAALGRARERLAAFRRDPARHARHAARVLLKYHVMERRQVPLPALENWAGSAPLVQALRQGFPDLLSAGWVARVVADLAQAGALRVERDIVHDLP